MEEESSCSVLRSCNRPSESAGLTNVKTCPAQDPLHDISQVGLKLLMEAKTVFHCHESRWNTIYHSELGSSATILAAGYNIDSFMTRYQVGEMLCGNVMPV